MCYRNLCCLMQQLLPQHLWAGHMPHASRSCHVAASQQSKQISYDPLPCSAGSELQDSPGSPPVKLAALTDLLIVPNARHTMRFGSTAKVLAECKFKYYRISE